LEEDIENFETMLKLLDLDTVEKVSISVENGLLLTHCHVDFLVNSVEGLLRLADKYIVPNLQKKCLVFLLLLDEKHILLKLQLSDTYMLAELEVCDVLTVL
jgi:hypothetical protein